MKQVLMAALMGLMIGAPAAVAADEPKLVGTWIVSDKKDAFTDAGQTLAMTPSEDGEWLIGLRCLNKDPSIMVLATPQGEDDFVRSAVYKVKFRADHGDVQDILGMALKEKGVEMMLTPEIFKSIEGAKTFAMRFTTADSDSDVDMTFAPKQSTNALDRVGAACNLH